ncbi:hypothetical protein P3X46_034410 [Hevea brasiliensis]|uniref:Uncharacterized protein n=1 Tax=Hevea brasiliensis TaxID=3981 RepID=A0ABQ9K9L0_HEVBR|nr:hypothetical protein P3X46_034410 [Hevea brasiliensis]
MIFQSFILGNLVSLCMKIINSVVVVDSIMDFDHILHGTLLSLPSPSSEQQVLLRMTHDVHIDLLCASHLALGRPHTITVLALPYLLFHFFRNNHKHFLIMDLLRKFNAQHLYVSCNNKMLFVTSSFVGWLIGHILFMKWVGLILVRYDKIILLDLMYFFDLISTLCRN